VVSALVFKNLAKFVSSRDTLADVSRVNAELLADVFDRVVICVQRCSLAESRVAKVVDHVAEIFGHGQNPLGLESFAPVRVNTRAGSASKQKCTKVANTSGSIGAIGLRLRVWLVVFLEFGQSVVRAEFSLCGCHRLQFACLQDVITQSA